MQLAALCISALMTGALAAPAPAPDRGEGNYPNTLTGNQVNPAQSSGPFLSGGGRSGDNQVVKNEKSGVGQSAQR